jgi:copper homeostasis protein (lipoprotein)
MKKTCAILSIGFMTSCNSASNKIASTDSMLKAVAPGTSAAAVYAGTLPCGDCEGIDVSLQLNSDSSYFMNSVYKGSRVDSNRNSFKDTGTWTMHGVDTLILSQKRNAIKYIKTDSTLTQLDGNGNIITGPLADMFILHKK